jgi:hypothetical protein
VGLLEENRSALVTRMSTRGLADCENTDEEVTASAEKNRANRVKESFLMIPAFLITMFWRGLGVRARLDEMRNLNPPTRLDCFGPGSV